MAYTLRYVKKPFGSSIPVHACEVSEALTYVKGGRVLPRHQR